MSKYESANLGTHDDNGKAICIDCIIAAHTFKNRWIEGEENCEEPSTRIEKYFLLPEDKIDLCWSCCQMIDESE